MVKIHEQNKKNFELEIASYRDESTKQRKIIFQLEKERQKYISETSDLNHRIITLKDDVKMKKMDINDSHKKVTEANVNFFFSWRCNQCILGALEAAAGTV